jgi:hypothetical protein
MDDLIAKIEISNCRGGSAVGDDCTVTYNGPATWTLSDGRSFTIPAGESYRCMGTQWGFVPSDADIEVMLERFPCTVE